MKKKIMIPIIIVIIIIVGIIISGGILTEYHTQDSSSLTNTTNVTVSSINNGLYFDGPGNESAIVFYPGAQIEYTAYSPLLKKLAENGVDCFLVKMPLNYAILNINAADDIINKYNYTNWYITGHSFGGAMAAAYAHNHLNKINGVILLAAYSKEDIKDTNVLCIYGDNDQKLNLKTYQEDKVNLPTNYTEYIIHGGNHDQYGSYGNPYGNATISPEQQLNETVNAILLFIESVNKVK